MASLTIASILVMALAANQVVARVEIRRPWLVGGALVAMLGGVAEYLSLVTGFRVLLALIAACYLAALVFRKPLAARARSPGSP